MSKADNMNVLLQGLLDCGYLDVETLLKTEYDMTDIKDEAKSMGYEKLDINVLLFSVLSLAQNEFQSELEDKISELENDLDEIENDRDLNDEEKEEKSSSLKNDITILESIDFREDTETFINFMDSHIWWSCDNEKKELCHRYMQEEIDDINNKIGFSGLEL